MLSFEIKKQDVYNMNDYEEIKSKKINILKNVIQGIDGYQDSLGWFDVKEHADKRIIANIQKIADEIRKKADIFILIGVGGSNNSARSIIEAFKIGNSNTEILYSGNTLSPHQLKLILKKIEGKSVYVNCIAKNFETLEPGSSFRVLRQYLYKTYGENAANRIIITGTNGSRFDEFSKGNGYRFLDFPKNVGGRYTAITAVSLLSIAVAGININEIVQGGKIMQAQLHADKSQENPAFRYACFRNLHYKNQYKIEMLSYFEPQFRWFTKWWQQLFAESEGKNNLGLYPTYAEYSEDLHSIGQYVQDGDPCIFETFIQVTTPTDSLIIRQDNLDDGFNYLNNKDFWNINQTAFEATVSAHSKKLPISIIRIDKLDAFHFGQLFYFFEFACYLSCEMMGVNPFNQPGVEEYKKKMFSILKK